MMKSRLFAKGRTYSGVSNADIARRFPDTIGEVNSTIGNRIVAPAPTEMVTPTALPIYCPSTITSLVVTSQSNLLKSYQLELNTKEKMISNQRGQIKRLSQKGIDMQALLRRKRDEIVALSPKRKRNGQGIAELLLICKQPY